jgi:hypothetical protein
VRSVYLLIDDESLRLEWNRHSEQWECKNDLKMEPVLTDLMEDLFAQPGTDFLRAQVRVDDQLLEFEWSPEDKRWEGLDISGGQIHLDAALMQEMFSTPISSLWAYVF